ncbi:MAG: hypothetical protein IB616_01335 [Methanosarcinales archaeon]|nr:MAG: hypothetical protein IB616_01335 [Methanosarcinales archaeon]
MSAPGVEALINIVLILALVSITAYYAHQVRKQTEIMREDRERPQIVELMKGIVTPFIHQLEVEIRSLEKGEYEWDHRGKRAKNVNKLIGPERILNDLKRKSPPLKEKIENHNERCSILREKLENLDKAIYTREFEEKCRDRVAEHNKKYRAGNPEFLSDGLIKNSPEVFVGHIIDNRKELFSATRFHDFWRGHGAEFLEMRNRGDIKDKIDEIGSIAEELKSLSQEIKDDLEQLREKYSQKYHLLMGEIGFKEI